MTAVIDPSGDDRTDSNTPPSDSGGRSERALDTRQRLQDGYDFRGVTLFPVRTTEGTAP